MKARWPCRIWYSHCIRAIVLVGVGEKERGKLCHELAGVLGWEGRGESRRDILRAIYINFES